MDRLERESARRKAAGLDRGVIADRSVSERPDPGPLDDPTEAE